MQAQKQQVIEKVSELVAKGNEHYDIKMPVPNVVFKKRGTVGGTACFSTMTLNFNAGLLVDNTDEYLTNVAPHEVAHLFKNFIHGEGRGKYYSSHGLAWQNIMINLGAEPSRTHSMDVSKTAMPKSKFIYACSVCNNEVVVGPKVHNKILKGYLGYAHKGCANSTLTFKRGLGKISTRDALKMKAPKTMPKMPKKAKTKPLKISPLKVSEPTNPCTRISKALSIYKRYLGATRQEMITYIVSEMKSTYGIAMTRGQAAGYYQNCKKRVS